VTGALLLLLAISAQPRSWAEPREPFHVVGDIYSVGSAEVTSFLIASPKGHVLIDGGFVETAPQIIRNIDKLGFKLEDVKVLLSSHAHFDHAGGLAELKRRTGAQIVASRADGEALARGGKGDPQFGDSIPFAPVYADRIVQDGGVVRVGPIELVAHVTPGHTQGCTTWTTVQREDDRAVHVVFVCSVSVPDEYHLLNNPRYPRAVEDYERSFRILRSLRRRRAPRRPRASASPSDIPQRSACCPRASSNACRRARSRRGDLRERCRSSTPQSVKL
jgi:metallo-beta-lactamase class B